MLAILAIKLDLKHAERPIKVNRDFVQLEVLYKWIWLQDLAVTYLRCLKSENIMKGENESFKLKNVTVEMNHYTNLCYRPIHNVLK